MLSGHGDQRMREDQTQEQKSLVWFEHEYSEDTITDLVSQIQILIDEGHTISWGNMGPKLFLAARRTYQTGR